VPLLVDTPALVPHLASNPIAQLLEPRTGLHTAWGGGIESYSVPTLRVRSIAQLPHNSQTFSFSPSFPSLLHPRAVQVQEQHLAQLTNHRDTPTKRVKL
jgi:hypothetical protein